MSEPSVIARRLVRIGAIVVAVFLGARILYRIALPTGSLIVESDIAVPAAYVSELKPSGRFGETLVDANGIARTPISAEPVYIDLSPPFVFDSVSVALSYENPEHDPVELAALASTADDIFERRIVEQPLLDTLPWKRIAGGRYTLAQRTPLYASVDEFLRTPPPRSDFAMLGAESSFLPPFRIENYSPLTERRELEVSLRGRHELLTYVKNEPLDIAFVVQDMNREEGGDPVQIVVRRGDDDSTVSKIDFLDDGNTAPDQKSSPLRTLPVIVPSPAEGFYRISFASNDDVFIRKIVTRQRKLSFESGVYLGDRVGYSDQNPTVVLHATGAHLEAVTHHTEGLQSLSVGTEVLTLIEPHSRVIRTVPAGEVVVTAPKGDVVMGIDGVMAFSSDELFDPLPVRISALTTVKDLDARKIDYLLAAYEPPVVKDGVTTAVVEYDLHRLDRTHDGAYRFAISLPALSSTGHDFRIRSIRAAFSRPAGDMNSAFQEFFLGAVTLRDKSSVIADPVSFRDNLP